MIWGMLSGESHSSSNLQERFLRLLYETVPGRLLLRPLVTPAFSKACGILLETRVSSLFVKPFVKANNIDLRQCEKKNFASFNQFFTRVLKPGSRPICMDDDAFISPCDARLSVYHITMDAHFTVKDTPYTVADLLKDEQLAKSYKNGTLWLFRLSVDDYHRYIYPMTGRKSHNRVIPGKFHTVNPLANDVYPIYKENSREYCLIKGDKTTILMMEVGALMVGKIENHNPHAATVCRGKEKGNFAFGGSTIIVLTKEGSVTPDELYLANTKKNVETKVKMGQKIGKY